MAAPKSKSAKYRELGVESYEQRFFKNPGDFLGEI